MADATPPSRPACAYGCAAGVRAFTHTLRQVRWPRKFKPEMPPRYDGATDLAAFLHAYEKVVLEAGGDDRVMANLFPLALVGVPCAWLLSLPGSSVTS